MATKKTPAKKAPSKKESAPKKKSGGTSLATLWRETDPSEATNFPSEGEHEMRLNSIEISTKPGKGTSAFAEYEIIEGDEEGKKGRQQYTLVDKEGEKGAGVAYLMRDLALLGYADIDPDEVEDKIKEISEEQPMCIVRVKQNGQYTNFFLQGPSEGSGGGDGDGGDDAAFEVGDKVKWDDDGEERTGEIKSINKKKETAVVEDDDGDEYQVDLDDLSKADEGEGEGEDEPIAVGDEVTWNKGKNRGTVKKIIGDQAKVEDEDGDVERIDLDDLTKAESDGEGEGDGEYSPEVGDDVKWDDDDGDEQTGEIIKIIGDHAKIKDSDDDIVKVEISKLSKND